MNLGKSELIVVGDVPNVDMLVVDLNCRIGSLPSRYFTVGSLF